MSILSPFFQKLFVLPGVTAILAVNIDTGEPLLCVGEMSDEKANRISSTNAKMLRLKLSMVADQYQQDVEDITVSLSDEYHLIYLLPAAEDEAHHFLYVILNKNMANLAYARHKISALLANLSQRRDDVRLLEIEADYLMDRDNIRTKIHDTEAGRNTNVTDDMPSFLRTEVALQLLGIEAIDIMNAEKYPLPSQNEPEL